MAYSNLVDFVSLSPNRTAPREAEIDTITLHHTAGVLTAKQLANIFMPTSRGASCSYGVGNDCQSFCGVDENNRPWTTSSAKNDKRAITFEISNNKAGGDWTIADAVIDKTVELLVDICKRNTKLNDGLRWQGVPTLIGQTDKQNMTIHKWFSATACPGTYLERIHQVIVSRVNERLAGIVKPDITPVSDMPFHVQTGAFKHREYAERLLENLEADGFDTYMIMSGGLYKVQVGAFNVFENAERKAMELAAKKYDYFITKEQGTPVEGKKIHTTKTIDELAREVIRGIWGNGTVRRERLTAEGYDAAAVQARVDQLLG